MLCFLWQPVSMPSTESMRHTYRERCSADNAGPLRQMHDNIPMYGLARQSLT